jgi:cell division protein FtsN
MSRDYRKPSTARTQPRSQTKRRKPQQKSTSASGFAMFVSGAAVGALLTALILVPQLGNEIAVENTVVDEKPNQQSNKPRFDFYTLLGENEVVVAEDEQEDIAPTKTNKPAQQFVYLLQVGSFRNSGDADGLRAKLLLMNFEVKIDPIKSNSGALWHRVIVGPFVVHGTMAEARDKLASNGIDVLLLKRNK